MEVFVPPCVSTPEFIHAAMRPDVITETVVEVSTEESEPMDTSPIPTSPDSHEPMKKKKGRALKDEFPRSVAVQYAIGDQWRNNFRKNEETEPK